MPAAGLLFFRVKMRCQGKGAGPGDIYSPNTKMSLSGTCDSVGPTHVSAGFLFCRRKYCKDTRGVGVEHLQSVCVLRNAVLCFLVAVRTETGEEGRTLVQSKVLEKAQAGLPSSVCSTLSASTAPQQEWARPSRFVSVLALYTP